MTPPPDLLPVPTVADLVARKLARPVAHTAKGDGSHFQLSPAGQAEIFAAMSRNAAELRERAGWISCPRCDRTDPHTHGRPLPVPAAADDLHAPGGYRNF